MIYSTTKERNMTKTADIDALPSDTDRNDVLAARDELVLLDPAAPAVVEDTAENPVALTHYDEPLTAADALAAINARYPDA